MRILISIALLVTASAAPLQEVRWDQASVLPSKDREIDSIIERILKNKDRYVTVDQKTTVPWVVIAGLHNMESGGSFLCHLYEGSPLTGRTRYEPKGRPTWGFPPFKWEDSAADALFYDKMNRVDWDNLNDLLYGIEAYNGTGVLKYHPDVPTPYLWSGTSIYTRGKYVSDGIWSSTAVSSQVGVAAIFKRMEQRGIVQFSTLAR